MSISLTEKIKILLVKKSLKQKDVAKKFKISKAEVSNGIAGRNRPLLQEKIYNYLKSL